MIMHNGLEGMGEETVMLSRYYPGIRLERLKPGETSVKIAMYWQGFELVFRECKSEATI
jgi:hypothetical protein